MATVHPACPICDAPLPTEGPEVRFRPFCCARCKLLDLSRWLGEEYRVAGPAVGDGFAPDQDNDDEELP